MNPSSKIAKEATISFAGMSFGQVLRYIFTASLARLVGVEFLGIYSIANSITRIFEVFGKSGLDTGILRFVSMRHDGDRDHARNDIQSALKIGLTLGILMMGLQMVLSGLIVTKFYRGNDLLELTLFLLAFSLPFSVTVLIGGAATQGFKLLKYKVFVGQILVPLTLISTMIMCYYFLDHSYILSIPIILASMVGAITILFFLRNLAQVKLTDIFKTRINRDLYRFSLPLMFLTILGTLMHWTDILMIGYFLDEASVGAYMPAVRTAGLIRSVMIAFISIFSPMISELNAKNDVVGMKNMYRLIVRWILSIAIPISLVFILFPSKVMLIFGGQFLQGSSVLVILTGAVLIQSFFGAGGQVLTMTGHPKVNLMNSIIITTINIVLNIILIPKYGIEGAAYATMTSFITVGILRSFETYFLVNLHPYNIKLMKPILAGLAAAYAGILIRPYIFHFHTVITLAIAAFGIFISFYIALWVMRFDEDDRSVITGLVMLKRKG